MLLPPPPTPPPFAQYAPDGVQKILIGNKADEEHKRQVAKEQGLQVSWGGGTPCVARAPPRAPGPPPRASCTPSIPLCSPQRHPRSPSECNPPPQPALKCPVPPAPMHGQSVHPMGLSVCPSAGSRRAGGGDMMVRNGGGDPLTPKSHRHRRALCLAACPGVRDGLL